MSELDEVIEALEAMDTYVEYGEDSEEDYNDTVDGFWAALSTLRSMRERAVEVRTEDADRGCSCAAARSWEVHVDCGHGGQAWPRAILIPEPPEES